MSLQSKCRDITSVYPKLPIIKNFLLKLSREVERCPLLPEPKFAMRNILWLCRLPGFCRYFSYSMRLKALSFLIQIVPRLMFCISEVRGNSLRVCPTQIIN